MRRSFAFATLFVFAIAALIPIAAYFWLQSAFEKPFTSSSVIIEIDRGTGVRAIAHTLHLSGAVSDPRVFEYGVRLFASERPLKAGEFEVPAGSSAADVARILQSGERVAYYITIPEGLSIFEAIGIITAEPRLSGDLAGPYVEGSILPETYQFHRGDDRSELLRRMQQSLQQTLDELWPNRQPNLPIQTRAEALILASIVEKETSVPEERRRVAAVFINRLREGMRLQSDPTVIYGITLGRGPLGREISRTDLRTETPYNTYRINRLPPGPIANSGRASIAAVLDPLKTDEFYFVADGSGGHAFSKTLREHNRNVRRWRQIQRGN